MFTATADLDVTAPVFAADYRDARCAFASHDVTIADEAGAHLFHQRDVRAPVVWSARAVRVAASKYLYGDPARGDDPHRGGRERSIYDLHQRVADFVADRGRKLGVLDSDAESAAFARELQGITLGQYAAFNSPVWFNCGLDRYGLQGDDGAWAWVGMPGFGSVAKVRDTHYWPQCSACFIQSVDDNMESLMRLARNEAMLFKHGSGTGTDFSGIRSRREKLSGGGVPSGPLSFLKIYDRIASVVKSGGKTRRAAKMQTMDLFHPDILDFIRAKSNEEKKAHALIAAGWPADFNGEAYDTVAFQNANFSVRVNDEFMFALEAARQRGNEWGAHPLWATYAITTGAPVEYHDPRVLWRAIAEETWRCGDPGIQYKDTINRWHTCPRARAGGYQPINSSNPCSEYLFIDDSACNLASINLMWFQEEDGIFNTDKLKSCVRRMITAMEILVDASSYPTKRIAQNSHDFRPLGLGFANLGGLLQANGIPYDSDAGRHVAGLLAAIICGEAYAQSARLATKLGVFPGYPINEDPMLKVIQRHWEATHTLIQAADHAHYTRCGILQAQLNRLSLAAQTSWDEALALGQAGGYRNAQVTVVAPTGTIAFMMDCDTTGIEPNVSLKLWKALAGGGGMWVVNRLVGRALSALGYDASARPQIESWVDEYGTIEGCPWIAEDDKAVFDCALAPEGYNRVLRPEAHLLMLAAVQPFVSGSISKTVNVPEHFTVEEIEHIYERSHTLGVKCVAIYRDNSKRSQPLSAQPGRKVECKRCGSLNVIPTGTCGVCAECGEPVGGCS